MANSDIHISIGPTIVGKIVVPDFQAPSAGTLTDGFTLGLKANLQLDWAKGQPRPMVRALIAHVGAPDGREVGIAEANGIWKGSLEARAWEIEFKMRGSLVGLIRFRRHLAKGGYDGSHGEWIEEAAAAA